MIEQVKETISSSIGVQGYLLDGFPITQEQGMQFEMEVIISFSNVPNLKNIRGKNILKVNRSTSKTMGSISQCPPPSLLGESYFAFLLFWGVLANFTLPEERKVDFEGNICLGNIPFKGSIVIIKSLSNAERKSALMDFELIFGKITREICYPY